MADKGEKQGTSSKTFHKIFMRNHMLEKKSEFVMYFRFRKILKWAESALRLYSSYGPGCTCFFQCPI